MEGRNEGQKNKAERLVGECERMFDSGIPVLKFVSDIKKETDIIYPVPNSVYTDTINLVQQLLYSELICEEGIISLDTAEGEDAGVEPVPNDNNPSVSVFEVSVPNAPAGQDKVRFEDIKRVYFNGTELMRSSLYGCRLFGNAYAKSASGGLVTVSADQRIVNAAGGSGRANIIYIKRPELLRTEGNSIIGGNIMLPAEFTDMLKAKVRGEVYKLVNEDAAAAKWLADYNSLLETFKQWILSKAPHFGVY